MKSAIVALGVLLSIAVLCPVEAGADVVRHRHVNHHRPARPVHKPAHYPAHRRPVHHHHVHRNVVIGAGYRPVNPWWRPGAAIAAGAAIGYVAASAATWAGPPPGPTYCWFYTDSTRTKGFWDICPK